MTATTTTTPPRLPPVAVWRAAQARAAALGLSIDLTLDGVYHFVRRDGTEHNCRGDWPSTLELLSEMERAREAHYAEA